MRYLCYLFLLGMLSCSCEKDSRPLPPDDTPNDSNIVSPPPDTGNQPQWKSYLIPAGNHYAEGLNFRPFPHDSLYFRLSFDSSAVYHTSDPKNQADWNKLMGFSDCGGFHQQNSVRVVWRYLPETGLELGEYYYVEGQRIFNRLKGLDIKDTTTIAIYTTDSNYHITCGQTQSHQARQCNNKLGRYQLYPYFGGDEVAPHDIRIAIQQLYPQL